ncbi:hybrid sensor histidine kinase/response regulator [Rhodophyticola sp. CCM32]|uniref:hybrid sensor histidine kinase/response regulator n=1 Tax=Rhodophyticola sp. CCM32 TaxID=2916397 RepID=UPI001EE5FAFC|nr:ATP-binding protein [Rhodophyticola sp. CCM32]
MTLIFFAAAGSILALTGLVMLIAILHRTRERRVLRRMVALIERDPAPCLCTDKHGGVVAQNQAATDLFGSRVGQPVSRALSGVLANAPAVVFRQEATLARSGMARETVVTRKANVRLTAHRVSTGALWRLDETVESASRSGDHIALPMMVVSPNDTILSMNDAMRDTLGRRAHSLSQIFTQLPLVSGQRRSLQTEAGIYDVTPVEIRAGGGRREIYVIPAGGMAGGSDEGVAARAFEALPVALVHIGREGEVLAFNQHAQTLLGLTQGEGPFLSNLVEGLGRPVDDWLRDTLEERIPHRPEVVRAKRRDKDCFLQITLGRIATSKGPSLLAVLHDATELKTLEQQFVQSQKMQAIGELAGGIAHDFNNLLTAITGHCDLLLLRHDQGDPDYGDLMQINQNANRAASLVGQLLAFSRKQTLQPELLDLRDTMGDLTHLLNRLVGEKIQLHLSHDPGLLPIRADRRQLDQVLMNLVVNARDAMPEGGTVHVETHMLRLTEPMRRDQAELPPGHYVSISVRDTGTGIAADRLRRIFEPFYTTKVVGEGTGLGLSMAYGIIKQTGGYIFADSVLGEGTTFTIYCPAHDRLSEDAAPDSDLPKPGISEPSCAEAPADQPDQAGALPETGGPVSGPADGVVLLVEDEAPVRAFASRALRLRGYTVLEAENAEEALEKLRDASLSIDVFVTDVVMPGMDGPSWVREALKDRPGVKVVFVSGYAEDALDKTSEEIPNSVFLPKPFSLSDLTATVQRQLH